MQLALLKLTSQHYCVLHCWLCAWMIDPIWLLSHWPVALVAEMSCGLRLRALNLFRPPLKPSQRLVALPLGQVELIDEGGAFLFLFVDA